jgi:hypothetical protein
MEELHTVFALRGRDFDQGEHKVRPYTDWVCLAFLGLDQGS